MLVCELHPLPKQFLLSLNMLKNIISQVTFIHSSRPHGDHGLTGTRAVYGTLCDTGWQAGGERIETWLQGAAGKMES